MTKQERGIQTQGSTDSAATIKDLSRLLSYPGAADIIKKHTFRHQGVPLDDTSPAGQAALDATAQNLKQVATGTRQHNASLVVSQELQTRVVGGLRGKHDEK
jgi:hypothetical protein